MGNVLGLPSTQRPHPYHGDSDPEPSQFLQALMRQKEFRELMRGLGHFFHEHGEYQKRKRQRRDRRASDKSKIKPSWDPYDNGQYGSPAVDPYEYDVRYSKTHPRRSDLRQQRSYEGYRPPYIVSQSRDDDPEESFDSTFGDRARRPHRQKSRAQGGYDQSAYHGREYTPAGHYGDSPYTRREGASNRRRRAPYETKKGMPHQHHRQRDLFPEPSDQASDHNSGNDFSGFQRRRRRRAFDDENAPTAPLGRRQRPQSH